MNGVARDEGGGVNLSELRLSEDHERVARVPVVPVYKKHAPTLYIHVAYAVTHVAQRGGITHARHFVSVLLSVTLVGDVRANVVWFSCIDTRRAQKWLCIASTTMKATQVWNIS